MRSDDYCSGSVVHLSPATADPGRTSGRTWMSESPEMGVQQRWGVTLVLVDPDAHRLASNLDSTNIGKDTEVVALRMGADPGTGGGEAGSIRQRLGGPMWRRTVNARRRTAHQLTWLSAPAQAPTTSYLFY